MEARALKNRSVAMMAVCALMWSTGGIFIKLIPWSPFVIAGGRSLVAAVAVYAYMRLKKMAFRWNRYSVTAGVALALTLTAYVVANKLTTAANAIVLQFTAPVFILLISYFMFGERFSRGDYVTVAITLVGVALCFAGQMAGGHMAGNLVAVASGLFYATMYVASGRADSDSRMSGVLLGQVFAAAIGLPFAFFTPVPLEGGMLGILIALGIVQLGIPYILYSLAMEHCPPLLCCLISALEPLINPVWVFIFNGESPGALSIVGGLVVVAAVTLHSIRDSGAPQPKEEPTRV